MNTNRDTYEDIAETTQLLVIPFLAGIAGILSVWGRQTGYRVTLHRTMCRHDKVYLQQTVNYIASSKEAERGSGRIFPVDRGIIGAAFRSQKMHHTAQFSSDEALVAALGEDMRGSGDERLIDDVAYSYLAIPFLGRPDSVTPSKDNDKLVPLAVLYAECYKENIFSDSALLRLLSAQCNQFSEQLDRIEGATLSHIRNFSYPIYDKSLELSGDSPYVKLNSIPDLDYTPPVFRNLKSINFQFYEGAA
ncbi:hypothetical protein [Janthinobacterium tructae]